MSAQLRKHYSQLDTKIGPTVLERVYSYGKKFLRRLQLTKGANVDSAATITLGNDGNVFAITGTTAIDYITTTNWQAGSEVTLLFGTSITVNHASGSPAATSAKIRLNGAANVAFVDKDSLTLVYDGTDWREVARKGSVPGGSLVALSVGTASIAAGAVTTAKLGTEVRGAAQALSGAGAVNLTTPVTRLTTSGAGQALTLADGSVIGQRKRIIHAVDGGSAVLTADGSLHLGDSIATITFTNVRDWVDLEWNGTAWDVIAYGGVTFT